MNPDSSPPQPAPDRAAAGLAIEEERVKPPLGHVISLDDARGRRLGTARRSWRPKGW